MPFAPPLRFPVDTSGTGVVLPVINLLIATQNRHKLEEICAILGREFHYLSLGDFPTAPQVVEDAGTFSGNSIRKAVELAKWTAAVLPNLSAPQVIRGSGVFVLADDSGLEVDCLKGAPGVHSARFAALDTGQPGNSPSADNNEKLLRLLRHIPMEKRTARFRCVLALTPVLGFTTTNASPVCTADEFEFQTQLFEGTCEGRILLTLQGSGGFGYDPLFIPDGYDQTFGQLPEQVKNQISHRVRALSKLKAHLVTRA